MSSAFRALFLEKNDAGVSASLRELTDADLTTHAGDGDVVVFSIHAGS